MDISTAKHVNIFRVKNSDMFMLRGRAPLCLSILSTSHQLAPTHVHTKELTDAASSILIKVIIKKSHPSKILLEVEETCCMWIYSNQALQCRCMCNLISLMYRLRRHV